MSKFRVNASYTTYCYIDIEAGDEEKAMQIANEDYPYAEEYTLDGKKINTTMKH